MNTRHIIIRADASPNIGTGHVMRCLALAQAAKKAGIEVHMVCRISVEWVIKRLRTENIRLHILSGFPPKEENSDDLLAQLQLADLSQQDKANQPIWVVLDGYHFTPDCQKAVLASGYKLLVIDDYNHMPEYCCDILVNPILGSETLIYKGSIGSSFHGPSYSFLRQEFLVRNDIRSHISNKQISSLLLTLGGGDFSIHLGKIADCLTLTEIEGCRLLILAGAMPHVKINQLLKNCPASIYIIAVTNNLSEIMEQTDLCITAGGTTCWELCYFGIPFLTVEVAQNQHNVIEELHRKAVALRLTRNTLKNLLTDYDLRLHNIEAGKKLVDGLGCHRLLAAMECVDK